MSLPLPKFKWTHSGNYPAGPNLWSGQPLALPPAGSYFTPNVPPDAEELNDMFGSISDDIAGVQSYAAGVQPLNWSASTSLATLNLPSLGSPYTQQAVMAACWDPLGYRWIVAVKGQYSSVDEINFWETLDGSTYFNINDTYGWPGTPANVKPIVGVTPDQYFVSVCADPTTSGQFWIAWVDQGIGTYYVNIAVQKYDGTWPNDSSHRGSVGLGGGSGYARVTLHAFNGHMLYGCGSTISAGGALYRDLNPQVNCVPSVTATAFQFADNGFNFIMALPVLTATPANYWTSTDGVTWTAQSFAQVGGGTIIQTSDQVIGACYTQDSIGTCYLMCIQRGTSIVFYRSADGVNWSLQASPAHFYTNLNVPTSIAAAGPLVCVTGGDGYPGAWSPDGGITWYVSELMRFPRFNNTSIGNSSGNNLTSTYYMPPTVIASPNGFALSNSLGLKFSLKAGAGLVSLN